MDTSAIISAASGLLGALIGAAAALGAQWRQTRFESRSSTEQEHKTAVIELLVRAQSIELQAHNLVLLATNIGSINGVVARVLGVVTAVDFQAMFDTMSAEANALQRAAASIWLSPNPQTATLANAVVIAAMDVVEAHHQPTTGRIRNYTRIAVTGKHARDLERLGSARTELGRAREALIVHARRNLDLPELPVLSAPQPQLPVRNGGVHTSS